MKISNINNQKSFTGSGISKLSKIIAEHPSEVAAIAGSSVIAQKVIMSGSEAVIGPAMDIGIGKTITKITNEKDGRTNDSTKKQAVRTFSAAVGGTAVGIVVRAICIAGATYACKKTGLTDKIAYTITEGLEKNNYIKEKNAKAWGKSIGGAIAIGVMLFTNFLIDLPLINCINTKMTEINTKFAEKKKAKTAEDKSKEVK